MVLPQTVGFKAEAVDEEGVWCACTVEEVDDDYVIVSFDSWNVEWNHRVCDPRERSGIEHCLIGKEAKKPFPSVNHVFALRRPTFTFKYHPNLCKQKAQITVRFNFRREFA